MASMWVLGYSLQPSFWCILPIPSSICSSDPVTPKGVQKMDDVIRVCYTLKWVIEVTDPPAWRQQWGWRAVGVLPFERLRGRALWRGQLRSSPPSSYEEKQENHSWWRWCSAERRQRDYLTMVLSLSSSSSSPGSSGATSCFPPPVKYDTLASFWRLGGPLLPKDAFLCS